MRIVSRSDAPCQWAHHWSKRSPPPQQPLTADRCSGRGVASSSMKERWHTQSCVSVGDSGYYELMSSHALLRGQRFTALFVASDSFCLLFQDNPHGVGEEAIQVSSWSWAPSIHCFSSWQSYFENGFVKSSFSSPLNVSLFLSSYNSCSQHWNWGIPPWRSSSVSLGGQRPPFRSPPHSPSVCYSHSPFLGHTGKAYSCCCPVLSMSANVFTIVCSCAFCSFLVSGFEAGAGSVQFVFGKRHRPVC